MKIGVIGAGRLGICLALLIEDVGYDVIASDVREEYISDLQNGIIHTAEPGVLDYLKEARNIEFTTDNLKVIRESDIIFTLVQTPSLENGSYDVSDVDDVVSDFLKFSWEQDTSTKSLVIGCTTNPGDCDFFQDRLAETGVDVYYNPEFIAQGSIIKDLQNADMVLIGGKGRHSEDLKLIYEKIQMEYKTPSIHFMSPTAAEITKIAVNCFLTTKISYANMLGEVLSMSGMDDEIDNVLKAVGSDERIGNKYLKFGFGFGGPCFPRDNRAFAAYVKKMGVQHVLGKVTDDFNFEHAKFLKNYFIQKNVTRLPFLFSYLTYKPKTDILTESQQYKLCLDLLDEGYTVYCTDLSLKDRCDSRIKFESPVENVFEIEL